MYITKDPERKKLMNAKHAKTFRERLKQDQTKYDEARQKSTEKQKKRRQGKRIPQMIPQTIQQNVVAEPSAFSTVQQKGKLVKKTLSALPIDPAQREELLLTVLGRTVNLDGSMLYKKSHNVASLSPETVNKVTRFYCDEEVSRMSPNVKDFLAVSRDGKKVKQQVRYLQLTVKEVFEEFKKLYPDVKIGLSKFAELRPSFVKSLSKIPHNVCCCLLHENMRYALESMLKIDEGLINVHVGNRMDRNFVCDPPSGQCYANKCQECKDLEKFEKLIESIESHELSASWKLWQKPEKKSYINIEKVTKEGSVTDLINHISSMRQKFVAHVEVKRNQSEIFKSNIESSKIDSSIAVLQIDWAENYKCFAQNETQAAHFGQNQVSIFTAALWNIKVKTYAFVSDSLDHTKTSVIANIDKVCQLLPSSVKELNIYSDNATSQFKNKDTLSSMIQLEKKHKIKVFWHFFAAMHGKGVVDGVGASVKRIASNKSRAETMIINNAESFANALESSDVEVLWLSEEEKSRRNVDIGLKKIIAQAKKLKDISKSHHFHVNNGAVQVHRLSPAQTS